MDDEKLIEHVRKYSVLYDMSHSKYMDKKFKTSIWSKIGNEINETGTVKLKKKSIIIIQPKSEKVCLRKKQIIEIKPRSKPLVKILSRRVSEIDKHYENVKNVLTFSNATPIRCRSGVGYSCSFCKMNYPLPEDLKRHTLEKHNGTTDIDFIKGQSLTNYIVKLDITALKCNICNENVDALENFLEHLKMKHNKQMFLDIKNHIVPFKFDEDVIRCVVCRKVFNNFKVLLEHMNMHYKNYVCEVCGAGFVNKRILQNHGYRHMTGVFQCGYCPKIFDTKVKKRDHERAVHVCFNRRNKCGYCGEKFTDYTKKHDHEVKVHGAKPVVLKCQACSKTFDNQRALTVHTKNYHLMQKRYRSKQ